MIPVVLVIARFFPYRYLLFMVETFLVERKRSLELTLLEYSQYEFFSREKTIQYICWNLYEEVINSKFVKLELH